MHSISEKTKQMNTVKKEKMKVLIFGSTGSIGRELVKQALEQGHNEGGLRIVPMTLAELIT